MATDLMDSVDSLRYAVARPGTFSTLYPETTEDMLLQMLADGFSEAQLMGLLLHASIDDDGNIDGEMTSGQVALVVIFAAVRFLRGELINRNTTVVYEAGPTRYETQQSVNLLRDILADLKAQKNQLIDLIGQNGSSTGAAAFSMADQYLARICGYAGIVW